MIFQRESQEKLLKKPISLLTITAFLALFPWAGLIMGVGGTL
jgi:hypothetical protein